MFDWRELQRWGIDERRLPAGSTVLFRERTLWSNTSGRSAAAIALLVGQGLRHRRAALRAPKPKAGADGTRRRRSERYRTVADFTADWEFWKRPDGSLAYVSPSCLALTGYDATAFLERPALLTEIIVDGGPRHLDEPPRASTRTGGPGSAEFRIRTRGGEMRWVDHVCSPVIGAGRPGPGHPRLEPGHHRQEAVGEELRRALDEIQQLRDRLEIDNTYLREQLQPDIGIEGLIGTSDVMRYVVSKVQQVAPTLEHGAAPRRNRRWQELSRRRSTT